MQVINERYNCTNMTDYQQMSPEKKPITAEGNDERFYDEKEYERLRKTTSLGSGRRAAA